MYERTNWLDEVIDSENGETLQEGTAQSAGHFNNLEDGVVDNEATIALMMSHLLSLERSQTSEDHVITLKNTDTFPFSNASATVALDVRRSDSNYSVAAEITDHSGSVGEIEIYDKLVNAFKVKYYGPASSATLKLKVTGGSM